MKVGEYCHRGAVTIKPDASLADAAALMGEQHVGFRQGQRTEQRARPS